MEVNAVSPFDRVLKSRDVLTLAFGAMIGWSWVLMTGYWVSTAGTLGTAAAFLVGGVAIALIGLTYAELASAMPKAGGEHVYTLRALGPTASFICTWALLMAYVAVCLFESVALPTALEFLVPAIRFHELWKVQEASVDLGFVLVGIGGAIVMTWINLRGIRTAARVQSIVTLAILISGVLLISGAISFGSADNMVPLMTNGSTGLLAVLIMVPAMLVGFDVIPQSAEEIDLPPRRIGVLLVISVLLAVAWYVAISLSVAAGLDATALADSEMATADAASALWGTSWAGSLLVVGGIGGILTSWNAFIIGGSRVMFALGESGMLPRAFARIHPRYHTPHVSVLCIGVLSCLSPLFGRTILVWLIDAGSFAVVVAYIFVPLSFLALRRREPDMPRPFRLPAGRFIGALAALLGCALLTLYLPWSPAALIWPQEWLLVLGWSLLGGVFYLYFRLSSARADQNSAA
ncbi:MAG: amino acid permease [Gammaproteobacteria bacterium]|nr:MAG: amino acid permease [Gammaproteobacteria bacterium]